MLNELSPVILTCTFSSHQPLSILNKHWQPQLNINTLIITYLVSLFRVQPAYIWSCSTKVFPRSDFNSYPSFLYITRTQTHTHTLLIMPSLKELKSIFQKSPTQPHIRLISEGWFWIPLTSTDSINTIR